MSEATFRQHLNHLENILGQLQGGLETGSISQASGWYDEITEVVLNALDGMEDILNPRMGFDAESLEDEDVVESTDLEAMEAEEAVTEEDAELDETDDETDDDVAPQIEDEELESGQRS